MTREEMIDVAVRKVIFRSRVRPHQTAQHILNKAARKSQAKAEEEFRCSRVPYPGDEEARRLIDATPAGAPYPRFYWPGWDHLRAPEEYPFLDMPHRLRAIREEFRKLAEAG